MEILANRLLWSVVFVFILLLVTKGLGTFVRETKAIFSTRKTACRITAAAILIAFNWGIFIWAVEAGRILETSMGNFIAPLMSVFFGMVFLGERLNKLQVIAVICAAIGISVVVIHNGSLPWVSVSLAVTFAAYGLLKKIIVAQALTSIMIETLIISPVAAGYLYYLSVSGGNAYETADLMTILFLMGTGVVTATPLLFFTACTKRVPLYIVGFMQYIIPCLSLMIGVLIYGEPFTMTHALSFGFIWLGLAFFTWSQIKRT